MAHRDSESSVSAPREALAAILVVLCLTLLVTLLSMSRSRSNKALLASPWYWVVLALSFIGLLSVFGYHLQQRRRWREAASEYEGAICPSCGYSLVGLPARHICPECGRGYDLQKVRRRWRRWLGL